MDHCQNPWANVCEKIAKITKRPFDLTWSRRTVVAELEWHDFFFKKTNKFKSKFENNLKKFYRFPYP